jgi:hypothetical protein
MMISIYDLGADDKLKRHLPLFHQFRRQYLQSISGDLLDPCRFMSSLVFDRVAITMTGDMVSQCISIRSAIRTSFKEDIDDQNR